MNIPEAIMVSRLGLRGVDDRHIWDHAKAHEFVIVSKDTDFRERSYVHGAPPKVIWLDVGNAGTAAILGLLKSQRTRIEQFCEMQEPAMLILSIGNNAV